ncbi:hypothetical protein Hanom_Chr13g01241671 [Helianthus anomalus]
MDRDPVCVVLANEIAALRRRFYISIPLFFCYFIFFMNNYDYFELIAKIVPEVWTHLSFSSKMTLLYHFAPNVCNFLPFSSKPLT